MDVRGRSPGNDDPVADASSAVELALEHSGVGLFEFDAVTHRWRLSPPARALLGLGVDETPTLERIVASLHPGDRHLLERLSDSLTRVGVGDLLIEFRVVRPDGRVAWIEMHGRASVHADVDPAPVAAPSIVGTLTDITKHKAALHRARSRNVHFQTLTSVLACAVGPAEVIDAAVRQGGAALGATGGAFAVLVDDGSAFDLVAGPGINPRIVSQWRRYAREPDLPASIAVATRAPCYTRTREEYLARDPRFAAVAETLGIQADATLPLIAGDQVIGVLSFIFREPQRFDVVDDVYLRAVAEQCAQALERARLFEAERDARAALVRAHAEGQAAAERVQLALAAGAIVGTWDWELPSDRFTVDERFAASFGIDPALGRSGLSLAQVIAEVHPDDLPGLHAAIREGIARGGPYRHEYRVRGRDGVYRWIEANGRVDLADDGTPLRFPGVLLDIERRRVLELERDRATELLRAFIEAVPGVVYAKDRDGRLLVGNRGVTELVGKAPEDYLGKTDMEFLDNKAQAAAVMVTDRRVMDSGRSETIEEDISFPDGRHAVWLSTKAPFRDPAGRVVGLIGSSVDISERKRAEKSLIDADRRRNEFLAMLGHELRNPLAPITNAVHLLELIAGHPDRAQNAVQIIRRQTSHMARLVDDLLEVSRVTQGRIELRKARMPIAAAVQSAVESIRPLVREREQTLDVDVTPRVEIIADQARLTQVVANLLNNASKYTQRGGRIVVRAAISADDDRWAQIDVMDNGPGIDAELLPRIFDLFSQGSTTLDRSRGGLGLGLALVRQLVELHGGTVRAASDGPGRGARFTVCLPRVRGEQALEGSSAGRSRDALRPTRFLIVDDNVDAVETLGTLLEADGHQVARAYDGESALVMARRVRPEVVLLDVGLPRIDGWEVARRLRATADTASAVLLALSGYGQTEDRTRSRDAGFDCHLLKPVDLAAVYEAAASAMHAARPEGTER